ncbi:MAG TPA: hypothetical protein VHR86_06980, partial [Armatimonadota bacterium]|nr:hypothetical protein [Armatimonadota bacterium]
MKQLSTSFNMYSQDYDEKLIPFALWDGKGDAWAIRWIDLIQPYVKNRQILVCPSNAGGNTSWSYGYNFHGCSAAYNNTMHGADGQYSP